MQEPERRRIYRRTCKHYGMYGQCYKHSGWAGNFHISVGCNGNCRRMKAYDKKYGLTGQEYDIDI